MLIIVPIFPAFRRLMKRVSVVFLLLGVLVIFYEIFCQVTEFKFKTNMKFNMRAWIELNFSMFSYYLSIYIKKQTYNNWITILLKIALFPINTKNEPIYKSVTGI